MTASIRAQRARPEGGWVFGGDPLPPRERVGQVGQTEKQQRARLKQPNLAFQFVLPFRLKGWTGWTETGKYCQICPTLRNLVYGVGHRAK